MNRGHYFTTSSSSKYRNEIIKCDDGYDCTITCSYSSSCYNTTIFCPNSTNACKITCSGSRSCDYADIQWIPGNTNSLTCSSSGCFRTPYPPSTNTNTQLSIYCDSDYKCHGTIITCPDNAECQVICSGDSSCREAIIHCPSNHLCNVVCTGEYGCYNAIVHWKASGSSTFVCPAGGNQCNLINSPKTINATNNEDSYTFICDQNKQCASSIINCPSNGNCFVHCSGSNSCAGSIINCGHGDCNILCAAPYACDFATFYGPTNKDFSVYCADESNSCRSASIHAEDSSYFSFLSSSSSTSNNYFARNISIWFPPRKENIKRAYIVSNNNNFNGYYGYESQQFYAINGWLDVDIESDGVWTYQGGTMHCGINYEYSCPFNDTSWSCDTSNTICDSPNITTTPITTTSPIATVIIYKKNTARDTGLGISVGVNICIIVLLIVCCCSGWTCVLKPYLQRMGCWDRRGARQDELSIAVINEENNNAL